jgi:ABC-type glycerol-3-phosphate transport system substrate-binding protein
MRGSLTRPGTSTPLRAVLVCGAAVAVLTSCGGGSGTSTAAGTSSTKAPTSTSAPSSTAASGAAGGDFCTQARAFAAEAGQAVAGGVNGPEASQQLQALVTKLQSITPPPELASDWQSAVTTLQQFVQAYHGVNLSDPAQLQALEQKLAPLTQQLTSSGAKIDQYLQSRCGVTVGGAGGSSPTS